ncbi:hypothetical protein AB4Z19_15555 [Pseudoduganella sp. RAF19]|uniref:hypothetical protein n=1 Tax=Bacteria TaxID=2 RepID=UPI003F949DE2
MAKPKNAQPGTKVRARVLVDGAFGKVNDVVEVDAEQLDSLTGVVDADEAAVAYAESLAKPADIV